jgi:hypothetical protein
MLRMLFTSCIHCKREIPVIGHDPLSDSSHLKPESPIGVYCTRNECQTRYSTTFSKCYFKEI